MSLTKITVGGVVHDEEGNTFPHIEIEDAHNMGMNQMSNGLGLLEEAFCIVAFKLSIEHFDSRFCFQAYMLAQIDFSETPTSQQTDETIITELLSCTIGHLHPPL